MALTLKKVTNQVGGKTYTNYILEGYGISLAIKPQFENFNNVLKLLELVGKEENK